MTGLRFRAGRMNVFGKEWDNGNIAACTLFIMSRSRGTTIVNLLNGWIPVVLSLLGCLLWSFLSPKPV